MEKKSKTVKMEAKTQNEASQKLTYEQLENVANNLNNQCKQLYSQLQEAKSIISDFNDVGMLLSIIREGENFESAFIDRCTKKVQDIVTKMLNDAEEDGEEKEK